MGHEKKNEGQQHAITPQQLRQIQELAETIRYGSITLVFQDGILIQIDKSEKIRIPKT
ncbi:MAG TPA: YezD family protein [Pseudoflavonifractor sp.]|nr:YezD family protein [Pseudoflavonifractor sp.]